MKLPHIHWWHRFTKSSKRSVFYCRRCRCGMVQVKSAGPTGDGKWRDDKGEHWLSFELEEYLGAKEELSK